MQGDFGVVAKQAMLSLEMILDRGKNVIIWSLSLILVLLGARNLYYYILPLPINHRSFQTSFIYHWLG